jgi:hypothetical protein
MKYMALIMSLAVIVLLLYLTLKTNYWGLRTEKSTNTNQDVMDLRGQDAVDKARETVNSAEQAQQNRAQNSGE